ncbi:MAG TPA: DUF748 domain-containing protein [Cytophagaceae bacterium]|jgi:hypothetical protein|nr:DUF748 domain-containing protein [Cytophagaceae bacterium]
MKRIYKILIGIVVLLIVIRLILPYVVLRIANDRLTKVKGYYGHIEDIDIALIRGAYVINNFYLNKLDSTNGRQTDFMKAKDIDLSVEWSALFHGRITGELVFDSPVLIFTKDKAEIGQVAKDTTDFRKLLKDFMPLKINRFEINNGEIHYIDHTSNPKIDVSMKDTYILALNLSNVIKKGELLPSTVNASASVYDGHLTFDMKLNALAEQPTFDLNAELKNTNLVLLNDFLKAYGNFDVNKGNFGLYTEMSAKDGKFKGYVKPIIKDLDVVGVEDAHDSFLHKLWEDLVGTAAAIFKNHRKDQLATKVPLEGNFKDPKIGTIEAIWQVIRNAFIQALIPSIDNEININSVTVKDPDDKRNLLQKVFSENKPKKEDKKEERKERREERKEKRKHKE